MMSQERQRITIDQIVYTAQQTALRDGGHAPTIISQGDKETAAFHIHPLADTHDGRADQMYCSVSSTPPIVRFTS